MHSMGSSARWAWAWHYAMYGNACMLLPLQMNILLHAAQLIQRGRPFAGAVQAWPRNTRG